MSSLSKVNTSVSDKDNGVEVVVTVVGKAASVSYVHTSSRGPQRFNSSYVNVKPSRFH